MSDYSNGQIYKLTCLDPNIKEIYVGSTVNFRLRYNSHKSRCHNINSDKYNLKVYKYIRDYGGWNNWNMVLIKDFPCNSKRELTTEEDKIMLEMKTTLNDQPAKANLQKRKAYQKQYSQLETSKIKRNLRNKKYRDENPEKIKQKKAKQYQKNKEILKSKVSCECDSIITKGNLTKHKKTQKHQVYDFLSLIENSLNQ